MSWVFMAAERVYKLKKPVRYSFLDFSTIEARERNCREDGQTRDSLIAAPIRMTTAIALTTRSNRLRLGRSVFDAALIGRRKGRRTITRAFSNTLRLRETDRRQAGSQAHAFAKTFARDIQTIEKQIDGLLERMVEASNPTVMAYETKIAKLEREKLAPEEKRVSSGSPRGRLEDMFEPAMSFFANPSKLWHSGSHVHRRLVLKLTFADRLSYCRKSGFRTPEMALPFKALVSFREGENVMAEGMNLTSNPLCGRVRKQMQNPRNTENSGFSLPFVHVSRTLTSACGAPAPIRRPPAALFSRPA